MAYPHRKIEPSMTVLRDARLACGLTIEELAELVDSNIATISRCEHGHQNAKRKVGRAIYELFDGILTLGEVYDPGYDGNDKKLDEGRAGQIRQLARKNAGWGDRLSATG